MNFRIRCKFYCQTWSGGQDSCTCAAYVYRISALPAAELSSSNSVFKPTKNKSIEVNLGAYRSGVSHISVCSFCMCTQSSWTCLIPSKDTGLTSSDLSLSYCLILRNETLHYVFLHVKNCLRHVTQESCTCCCLFNLCLLYFRLSFPFFPFYIHFSFLLSFLILCTSFTLNKGLIIAFCSRSPFWRWGEKWMGSLYSATSFGPIVV